MNVQGVHECESSALKLTYVLKLTYKESEKILGEFRVVEVDGMAYAESYVYVNGLRGVKIFEKLCREWIEKYSFKYRFTYGVINPKSAEIGKKLGFLDYCYLYEVIIPPSSEKPKNIKGWLRRLNKATKIEYLKGELKNPQAPGYLARREDKYVSLFVPEFRIELFEGFRKIRLGNVFAFWGSPPADVIVFPFRRFGDELEAFSY